jgi:hypothetical protein
MATADLMALAGLNFASVFLAVWVMGWSSRRRSRRIADAVLEQIGRQIETEQAFTRIVRENFRDQEDGQ